MDKSDVIENIVAQIEARIKIKEYNNAASVAAIIMAGCGRMNSYDFVAISKRLLKVKSKVYLLALPSKLFKMKSTIPGIIPFEEKPFALWICMNGKDEFLISCKRHSIKPENNEENLKNCGILTSINS